MDIKALTKGNTVAIDDVVAKLGAPELNCTALEFACMLKRAEDFLATVRKRLRPEANQEFQAMQAKEPGKGQWAVGEIAMLTSYVPRSTWALPQDLLDRKAELDKDIQQAKKDGRATKRTPPADPTKDTLFAITLTDKG
jgi:hypothetical protein